MIDDVSMVTCEKSGQRLEVYVVWLDSIAVEDERVLRKPDALNRCAMSLAMCARS